MSESATSTTTPVPTTSTTQTTETTTTMVAPVPAGTQPFNVPVGDDGVTYLVDGDPPSGPTSFTVLPDGSVVIADTMAVMRGEPRLLHYGPAGGLVNGIDLNEAEVASIVDVVFDGTSLVVLDVLAAMDRYRIVSVSMEGVVNAIADLPDGYHFQDGLTGLLADDDGVLLEFELGARYARVTDGVVGEVGAVPNLGGRALSIGEAGERQTRVQFGDAAWVVERSTNLGGVTLVGASADELVVVVDEVDLSGEAVRVLRRVQRYTDTGVFISEIVLDAADQFVEVARPLELGSAGEVVYLRSTPDLLRVIPNPTSSTSGVGA